MPIDPKGSVTLPYWLIALQLVTAGAGTLGGWALQPQTAAGHEIVAVRSDLTAHVALSNEKEMARAREQDTLKASIAEVRGDLSRVHDAVLVLCHANKLKCQ